MQWQVAVEQVFLALAYYAGVVVIFRMAGKRLAGQTTTFDLIILISLGVVLQEVTLIEGRATALIFMATVFGSHVLLAWACARWEGFRHFVRGRPRPLVRNGKALPHALHKEGVSYEELLAGLRKLGYQSEEEVDLAVMEETGHISAIAQQTSS